LVRGQGFGQDDQAEQEIRRRQGRGHPEGHPGSEFPQQAAQGRTEDEPQAKGRADETKGLGALLRRRHVRQTGVGDDIGGAADPGDQPSQEQPEQGGRQGVEDIVDGQSAHGHEQQGAATDPVGQGPQGRSAKELGEAEHGEHEAAHLGGGVQADAAHVLDQRRQDRQDQAQADHVE
jgi:hypothetical protein